MIPCISYPKTDNLFARDEQTHKLILGQFREPQFRQVNQWLVTEKIDGTNIRLVYREGFSSLGVFDVRGRTDSATLPKNFVEEAVPHVDADRMREALHAIDPKAGCYGMVVFGEGYGPGIQKGGGAYTDLKSFRIFDVLTLREGSAPLWRMWEDVEIVAQWLGVKTVPVIAEEAMTQSVIAYVQRGPHSMVSLDERLTAPDQPIMEGVVARTDPYLYDRNGGRVMFKLKVHDLPS